MKSFQFILPESAYRNNDYLSTQILSDPYLIKYLQKGYVHITISSQG